MSTLKRRSTTAERDPRTASETAELQLRQRIAQKAYELFLGRGGAHGQDVQDWLAAESLVSAELRSGSRSKPAAPEAGAVPFLSARQRSQQR